MPTILIKTEAGQREIRDRAIDLPRSARTLLVLVDGVRHTDQLLEMVKGATSKDVEALVQAGLIAHSAASSASKAGPAKTAAAAPAEAAPAVNSTSRSSTPA